MVKVLPWQRPSAAPVPPQGAPGGSRQLGTPRKRPVRWAPSHHFGCSSQPPPTPPILLRTLPSYHPLATQAKEVTFKPKVSGYAKHFAHSEHMADRADLLLVEHQERMQVRGHSECRQ